MECVYLFKQNSLSKESKVETYKSGLNAELATIAPCTMQLTAVVPAKTGKKTYNDVLTQYMTKVQKPGFRAGHIPQSMIISQYGKDICADVAQQLLNKALTEVVDEKKLALAGGVDLENDVVPEYTAGQDFTIKATFEVYPEFELPSYKGLKATKNYHEIEQKKVDEASETFIRMHGTYVKLERPAEAGDMLRVDYTTDADEELKNNAQAKYLLVGNNAWQIMRDPETIPGITGILAGVAVNGEKDAAVTFPEDFRIEALRGKTLNYHFVVREVHGFQPPAFDDAFFKNFGVKDMDGVKKQIRERMEQQAEANEMNNVYDQVTKAYSALLDFELPPKRLAEAIKEGMDMEKKSLEGRGVTGDELAKELEAAQKKVNEDIPKTMRLMRAFDVIAQKENLQVQNDDLYSYCAFNAQQMGMSFDQFVKEIRNDRGAWDNMIATIIRQKVIALMVKEADITVNGAPEAK